jgi:hypothetical protein
VSLNGEAHCYVLANGSWGIGPSFEPADTAHWACIDSGGVVPVRAANSRGSHGGPTGVPSGPRAPSPDSLKRTKPLRGPPDFGLRDLWLSGSYHPRCRWAGAAGVTSTPR